MGASSISTKKGIAPILPMQYNNNILKFSNLPIIGFLFLFIYTPVLILPFNVIHILAAISLTYLLSVYPSKFYHIIKSPELMVFIIINIFLSIYAIFLNPFSIGNIGVVYGIVSTILEVLPCAIFISIVLLEHKIDLSKFYDVILLIGMIQVAWVFLTMVSPGLREWIISNSNSEGIKETFKSWGIARMYGLARGYTYALPLFQGLCIIIAYVLGNYKSSRYYLLIPFFIYSIAVNARVALISLFIVQFVVFIFCFKYKPIKQIISVIFLFIIVIIAANIIDYMAENASAYGTWVWLDRGIEDVVSYNESEKSGNLNALTDKMWFMPITIDEFLFGTGENIFIRDYMPSDIGYVVNLFYGGIIFSALLYLSYIWLLYNYYGDNTIDKNICISVLLYLFVANVKGNVFIPNEITHGVIILIVYSMVFRKYYRSKSLQA